MAEHWCKEHQTVFFKKGAMKGYAHPILDEEGEKTGGWCNEKAEAITEKPPANPKISVSDIERRRSMALSYSKDWCIAKVQAGVEIKTEQILTVAVIFESYIENGVVEKKRE